jgi:hypothetical protein
MYNNTAVSPKYGDKTPNQLYEESEKKYVKEVSDLEFAKIFWLNKEVEVNRSLIIHTVRKIQYIYEVFKNKHKKQLNGKKVRIYYDEHDASKIHVFTPEGEFVCTCEQKTQIHEAAVDRQEGEEEVIFKHESHCKNFYRSIEEDVTNIAKAGEEFTGATVETILPYTLEKEKVNESETRALLNAFHESNGMNLNKTKEYRPANPDSNKERFLNENKKQSSKGVFTAAGTLKVVDEPNRLNLFSG